MLKRMRYIRKIVWYSITLDFEVECGIIRESNWDEVGVGSRCRVQGVVDSEQVAEPLLGILLDCL